MKDLTILIMDLQEWLRKAKDIEEKYDKSIYCLNWRAGDLAEDISLAITHLQYLERESYER